LRAQEKVAREEEQQKLAELRRERERAQKQNENMLSVGSHEKGKGNLFLVTGLWWSRIGFQKSIPSSVFNK